MSPSDDQAKERIKVLVDEAATSQEVRVAKTP
jgi:hypothetical protein